MEADNAISFLGIFRRRGKKSTGDQFADHTEESLSNVFEPRPETGNEHFACQDSLIVSTSEKILKNMNVIV